MPVLDTWITALVAACGALLGAWLSARYAIRIFRLEQRSRETDELRGALAAYGAAVDRLTLHIEQLPNPGRPGSFSTRLVKRWKELDWVLGRLSIATVGRGAMRTVDELISVTNRLLLIAPGPVIDAIEEISDLISDFEPQDSAWKERWKEARAKLALASIQVSKG